MIDIRIDYLKTFNYALYSSQIPICDSLEIANNTDQFITDFHVMCQGEYIASYESACITTMAPGEVMKFKDFRIVPLPDKIVALTEAVQTHFSITVYQGEEILHEQLFELHIMPYDQWLGTSTMPQSLISFVTPNHPTINEIVIKAAACLKELTGSSAFTAYQTGDPEKVTQQVAAIFAALHQQGIVYRPAPPSFEVVGQRINLPEQVLTGKIGNCIELTLLMAAVLENVGINSVIILQNTHAFLGVWLVDDYSPQSVSDDASFLEKKCATGIHEMMVLECTKLTSEKSSFAEAMSTAEVELAQTGQFELFIDVYRCRLEHTRPLPSKVLVDGVWTISEGVQHDECEVELKEHNRYDLTQLSTGGKELTRFDIWERKLLDFSLRNALLNLSLRRRAIQFMSFDVNRIEDHLQEGKEYCLMPKVEFNMKAEDLGNVFRSKVYEECHELIANEVDSQVLHTYLPESATQTILKNIYRGARNSIEETGANSLFLSIGLLRWYETPQSTTPRYAPLLLLPVNMVYKKGRYYIRTRDEEIALNITLMEYLRQAYEISIEGLSPLPKDESGVDVNMIFAAIREALKDQKNWDVEEECVLGTFSFSKFLMWNDVHNHREQLRQNHVVSSLLANRLTWKPEPLCAELKDYDSMTPPTDVTLPMPADSSQMSAIIEGGKGHSFILYGPPGTGKSQTITNLIANALYHGRRVLFVAEKMAALSVVQSRLEKIGLAPFCLELHSNKSTKHHILHQLDTALKVAHIMSPQEYQATADALFEERKTLIAYMDELHRKSPEDGLSLHDCLLRYEGIDATPLEGYTLTPALAQTIKEEGTKAVADLLGSPLETVLKLVGQLYAHPLKGLNLSKGNVLTPDAFILQLKEAIETLESVEAQRAELDSTPTLLQHIKRNNSDAILQCDAKALYDTWRCAKAKWFIPRYFAKRSFLKKLRTYNPYITEKEVDPLLSDLLNYSHCHTQLEKLRQVLFTMLDIRTREDEMPAQSVIADAKEVLQRWTKHGDKLRDWFHWCEYRQLLLSKGLNCVVEALEEMPYDIASLRDSMWKAFYKGKAMEKMTTPLLSTFEGMLFDERVKHYRELANEFQVLTQKELYARLAANVPRVTENIDNSSEIGRLNRCISSGGRGTSIRDLFDQIPTLLSKLCPCMLMSPMSVAQYLKLNDEKIDLVVFDEASQMPTSEAVGAIARGKSLIVVGDPKQMPPTSFFSSTSVDEEEAYIDDMESILEDCRTLEMPSLQLNWHYRSRHESLIAFSNNEYYDGGLITFPSVDDQQTKVKLVPIEGVYDKGNKRTNRKEAEAIVSEIVRRLRSTELRKQSIGVIAFSVVQQGLIEDLLQEQLDKDNTLKEKADALYEPIFVKNLENVQGDERDVILFSIGYGPDSSGKVSMNFGPLNNAGGERRLNVAVSRARVEMIIYSTLKSSQIDLRRTQAKGVEGLKHFLEYAETQSLPSSAAAQVNSHESTIADEIAKELELRNFVTRRNVGRSQFKVDIALSDRDNPDVYRLGILLDGTRYHETQTTRDREIVQPSILSSLCWNVMRVWSVDWFNNRERVIERIMEKFDEELPTDTPNVATTFDISGEKEMAPEGQADHTYVPYEPSEKKLRLLTIEQLVHNIVETEQPITFAALCRRVCTLKDWGKVTGKIQQTLRPCLASGYITEQDRDNLVIWLSREAKQTYSTYRQAGGREFAEIPMQEVKNVLQEAITEQLAIQTDSLTLIAAKKMGFTRRGNVMDAAFAEALRQLTAEGLVETIDGKTRKKN